MHIAIIDRRGKRKYYVLRDKASDDLIPPAGMYLGKDREGREAILGEPSPLIYRKRSKGE